MVRCTVGLNENPHAKGPLVYIYHLNNTFRNGGKGHDCVHRIDCVFGGPPDVVRGLQTWRSGMFHWPMMVWYAHAHTRARLFVACAPIPLSLKKCITKVGNAALDLWMYRPLTVLEHPVIGGTTT